MLSRVSQTHSNMMCRTWLHTQKGIIMCRTCCNQNTVLRQVPHMFCATLGVIKHTSDTNRTAADNMASHQYLKNQVEHCKVRNSIKLELALVLQNKTWQIYMTVMRP
jgi:hypothetical protein